MVIWIIYTFISKIWCEIKFIMTVLIKGIGSPSSPTTPIGVGGLESLPHGGSGGVVKDSPLLMQEIRNLKGALNHVISERDKLIASDMQKKLAKLKPLKVIIFNRISKGKTFSIIF